MPVLEEIVREDLIRNNFTAPPIQADGKIHRFKKEVGDKKEDAWYVCFINHDGGSEFLAGAYGDWREGSVQNFCTHISLSSEKKKAIFHKVEKQFEAAQMERWEECARESAILLEHTLSEGLHPYLVRKKIDRLYGAKLSKDSQNLMIPAQDVDGKVWGFQIIDPSGRKLFNPGTKKRGNFFPLAEIVSHETIYICEGFATGCSIYEAIQKPVLVCFDAGNLIEVAKVVRAKYPECLLVVCGDNDVFTEGNPGKKKAEEAAKIGLGTFVLPQFTSLETKPSDFNDLKNLEGLDRVREQILGANAKRFYVKCLGFKGQTYFYTSSDNLQISEIQAHSEMELLKLMPMEYWESRFPGKRMKVDWTQAKSFLAEECRKKGIFTKRDVRGHGVWMDESKVIVHLGDRLYYDGEDHHIHSLMNQCVYEFDQRLPAIHSDPLSDKEVAPFLELMNSLNYTHKQQGFFLGGWMALAGICGALKWRPHLWLTGEPGTGKSTIKDLIDSYLNHAFRRLSVVGATTEAGIRQNLQASAIPLVFDEFEPEGKTGAERVQSCLELMRQASSENASMIVKGSADGDSISYYARFAAIVCSVKPRLIAEADRSRFTYIHLDRDQHNTEQWTRVKDLLRIMTPEYCKRFFARMVKLIPVILENKEILQRAFVDKGESQRLGQQYGSLMAGFVALAQEGILTDEEAKRLVDAIVLEDEETLDGARDQEEALQYLLSKMFRADQLEMPVRSWVLNQEVNLGFLGMKYTDDRQHVFVTKNNPQIGKLFQDSKWGESWYIVLSRIQGVQKKQLRLKGSGPLRGLLIPISLITALGDDLLKTL